MHRVDCALISRGPLAGEADATRVQGLLLTLYAVWAEWLDFVL